MKVTVVGPNLADQHKGDMHVHKTGCRDLRVDPNYRGQDISYTLDVDTELEVAADVYQDMINEDGGFTAESALGEFWFAPCTRDLR